MNWSKRGGMTRGRNGEIAAGHFLIHRILFATDFSRCASHAEGYAAFLANAYGASMDVIHVLELYPGMYAAAQDHREKDEQLADAVRRLQRQTSSVTSHVMTGIPSVQICAAAMDYDSDVIVMGTHGRTGLEHILLGSTAERVLTAAPCPVLTVRLHVESDEGPELSTSIPIRLQQLVVPVDFSDCALDALEYGVQMAKDFGASLTLLHILEPVPYGDDLTLGQAEQDQRDQRIDSQLRAWVSAIQLEGVSVREVIRGGVPADSILEFVRASAGDLIVMGTHGRRGISHMLRGSVAEAVLRRAPCPVLAMRNPQFSPGHQRVIRMETKPTTRPT